jgi:hypothetical protein
MSSVVQLKQLQKTKIISSRYVLSKMSNLYCLKGTTVMPATCFFIRQCNQ